MNRPEIRAGLDTSVLMRLLTGQTRIHRPAYSLGICCQRPGPRDIRKSLHTPSWSRQAVALNQSGTPTPPARRHRLRPAAPARHRLPTPPPPDSPLSHRIRVDIRLSLSSREDGVSPEGGVVGAGGGAEPAQVVSALEDGKHPAIGVAAGHFAQQGGQFGKVFVDQGELAERVAEA